MRIVIFTILLNFLLQRFEKMIKLYGKCHEKLKAFQIIETFMCDLLNLAYFQSIHKHMAKQKRELELYINLKTRNIKFYGWLKV